MKRVQEPFSPLIKKGTTFSVNMKLFNSKSKGGNTYPPPPAMSGFWQKNYQKPFIKVYLGGGGVDKKYNYSPRPLENIYDPNFVQVDGKVRLKSSSSGSE